MISVNYVIVEVQELYVNTEDGFIVNDSIENVESINRVATVISAPKSTIIKTGDQLIVHHNIFRKKYDVSGKQINSNFWLEDNKFFVPLTEIFMYKRDSDWIAIDPFCFIKSIPSDETKVVGFNLSENIHKGMKKHTGIVSYSNNILESRGIRKGDRVVFSKNSEYEFKIDGILYYKMKSKDILGVINERT